MATVSITLTEAWINLASDPTKSVHVARRSGTVSRSADAEVRQYAGGRLRVITRAGVKGVTTLSFRTFDRTIVDTLAGWVGQIVCVRDELGRRSFAMFHEVPETDLDMGWVDVALTFTAVSFSEAV